MTSIDPRLGSHHQVEGTNFFLLVGSQRSGTNFFRELLNTNDQTVVHGEVLLPYPHPAQWPNYLRTMVSRAQPPISTADGIALVDDYLVFLREDTRRGWPSKASALRAVGVDIKYNQLRFIAPVLRDLREGPFLLEYVRTRGIPIVHMVRANVMHQALSIAIAERRNVYHNYSGRAANGQVELHVDTLLSYAQWAQEETEIFRRLTAGMSTLEVCYEDLAEECRQAGPDGRLRIESPLLDGLRKFLGVVNDWKRPTSLAKVVDRPYAELVANHKEVVEAVNNSPFAKFAASI